MSANRAPSGIAGPARLRGLSRLSGVRGLYEVNAFRLRRILHWCCRRCAAHCVLHVSDVHKRRHMPARQRWLSTLGALQPDLVINTGTTSP
jgi:hypothetical protein